MTATVPQRRGVAQDRGRATEAGTAGTHGSQRPPGRGKGPGRVIGHPRGQAAFLAGIRFGQYREKNRHCSNEIGPTASCRPRLV
jgi:hypothetical protein